VFKDNVVMECKGIQSKCAGIQSNSMCCCVFRFNRPIIGHLEFKRLKTHMYGSNMQIYVGDISLIYG